VIDVTTNNDDTMTRITTKLNGKLIGLLLIVRNAGFEHWSKSKYKFHLTEYDAIVDYNEMIDATYVLLEKHFDKLTKRFMKDKIAPIRGV